LGKLLESFWKTPINALLEASLLRDAAEPFQLSFQDAASPVMEEILFLHNQIMLILIIIITAVLLAPSYMERPKRIQNTFSELHL
jgi:heme/copper-type cytochrome/quinol oxidase subunit 2